MEELELRMYFFVPYQLTGIQQGIQCGHAALEYADMYYNTDLFKRFVKNHKTWVVLNGGTTNASYDNDGKTIGSLNQIADSLNENNIDFEIFFEPDLNDALTAICFICDERVFNREKYPMYKDFLLNNYVDKFSYNERQRFHTMKNDFSKIKEEYPLCYEEWVNLVGGEKNAFLKNLIEGKKLA